MDKEEKEITLTVIFIYLALAVGLIGFAKIDWRVFLLGTLYVSLIPSLFLIEYVIAKLED